MYLTYLFVLDNLFCNFGSSVVVISVIIIDTWMVLFSQNVPNVLNSRLCQIISSETLNF